MSDTADLVESPGWVARHSRALPRDMTAYEAWRAILTRPLPGMATAMRLRDAVVARLGLERIGGFGKSWPEAPQPGDRLDFFTVERIGPGILTLAARDRHLDTITCLTIADGILTVTSSVRTHNRLGQLYMIPVGPAHRLIVRLMLARMR